MSVDRAHNVGRPCRLSIRHKSRNLERVGSPCLYPCCRNGLIMPVCHLCALDGLCAAHRYNHVTGANGLEAQLRACQSLARRFNFYPELVSSPPRNQIGYAPAHAREVENLPTGILERLLDFGLRIVLAAGVAGHFIIRIPTYSNSISPFG